MNWEEYKKQIEKIGKIPEDWYVLGIDLGTTNSVVSYWNSSSKSPEPIDASNGFGKIPLPSVVQLRYDGSEEEWVVGDEAFRSHKLFPDSTVRSIKRVMGSSSSVKLGKNSYSPEEISAKIIKKLVDQCQSLNPKSELAGVVVSVPYDFDDAAKKATMKACEIAGIADSLICLIEEPKAAALAYNFRHNLCKDEKILVFDFGGGTLDITLFHVVDRNEGLIKLRVISEGGEAHHGGDNVDEILLNKCYELIQEKIGQSSDQIMLENKVELELRARELKERLSGVKSFRLPFTFCIPPFVENITREAFESLISDFKEETRKLVLRTLREAYTGAVIPDEINRVLLEGGSSSMPWVKDVLREIFCDDNKIFTSERPALDISLGATYYAAMKMGLLSQTEIESETVKVEFEVTIPHDIGFEITQGGRSAFFAMIKRGTPYALAKKSQIFTLSGSTAKDMTEFSLKILERLNKSDTVEKCSLIGEVSVNGLPERPSGKTKLKITLSAEEEGGLIKGAVEDAGCGDEFPSSGFKSDFEPGRFNKTVINH